MTRLIDGLGALAQQTRLDVLTLLARAPKNGHTSGDLALQCGVSAGNMSTHLGILERSGLVMTTKRGRQVFYQLDTRAIDEILFNLKGRLEPKRSLRISQVITWHLHFRTKTLIASIGDMWNLAGNEPYGSFEIRYLVNANDAPVRWTRWERSS